MSMTGISWQPVKGGGVLSRGNQTPSTIAALLEKTLHKGFPMNLDEDDIHNLDVLSEAHAAFYGDDQPNPFKELVEAIETHGRILVETF